MKNIFLGTAFFVAATSFAQDKGVSTEGTCSKSVLADKGQLQVTSQELAKSLKEARNLAADKIERFTKALKKLDLENLEIETTGAQVYPQYEWEKNKNVFKGYTAQYSLKISSSSFEKMGEVLDLAVKHEIKNVGQLSNFLSKELRRKEEKSCLEAATHDAKEKAEILANSLGAKLGRVLRIVQGSSNSGAVPGVQMMKASFASDAGASPAFEAGKHEIDVHVSVSFELLN